MYVVKFKKKRATEACYASSHIVDQVKDIRRGGNFPLHHFFLSLSEARKIMFNLIMKNQDTDDWLYSEDDKLEYISIVELSHYPPHPEYQVIDYQEFK